MDPTEESIVTLIAKELALRFSDSGYASGSENGRTVFTWPSENPDIEEPLKLVCGVYPELYWYDGYFCDFIWGEDWRPIEEMVEELMDFLDDFFKERVTCALGGPVIAPCTIRHYQNCRQYPTFESPMWVRSWRGTWDTTLYEG